MRWSIKPGRIAGTEICILITFLIFLLWLGLLYSPLAGPQAALQGTDFVLALFGCVLLHESGQVQTARAFGVRTPEITLPPIGRVARLHLELKPESQEPMNSQTETPVFTIQCFEPAPDAVYSIESTAQFGEVSRRTLAVLYKHGLLTPVMDPECGGYYFNDEAIRRLQQIQYLRNVRGVNLSGIKMILELMEEMDDLRSEVASLNRELDELAAL